MTSSEIHINVFFDKILLNVNNSVMKAFRKFQVDIPMNSRVTAFQRSWKISIHLYRSSHVGGQMNVHQPILLYNIIKNCPTSLAYNSVFFGSNNIKFGTKTRCVVL